jgi:capsular polysaccharide biosynthesis protein
MTDLNIAAVEVPRSDNRVLLSEHVPSTPQLDQFAYRSPARFTAPEIRFSEPQPLLVTGDQFTIVCERSGLVAGSTYLFGKYSWLGLFSPPRPILPLPEAPILVCGNKPWRNYSHWLFQCLPPVLLASQAGVADFHALVPPLDSVKRQFLALAGLDASRYTELPIEMTALTNQGIYTNLTSGDFPLFPHPAIIEAFEALAAQAPRSVFAGRRVFLSRAGAVKRRMVNEAELGAKLEAMGYAVVEPGTLSAVEQIALFRDAAVIVGQHGAAMTNLLFAPRGEDGPIVVELHQENYVAYAFVRICQVKRLRYTAIFSRMVDPGGDGRHESNWEADIPLILETLASL